MRKSIAAVRAGVDQAREALRQVRFPGYSRDILSFGLVRDIDIDGDDITVRFAPGTECDDKVQAMERDIVAVLRRAGFSRVHVRAEPALDDASLWLSGGGEINPLQAELAQDGVMPSADVLREDLARGGAAPDAGPYVADVAPEAAPQGPEDPAYTGALPVFQWQIDPQDPAAERAETEVDLDGWLFHLWWQRHAGADLVYACLQATRDDRATHSGQARPHPVGRTEAVNLVYDPVREGVVAIYGTVLDFRPFVEAFRHAYLAENTQPDTNAEGSGNDQ